MIYEIFIIISIIAAILTIILKITPIESHSSTTVVAWILSTAMAIMAAIICSLCWGSSSRNILPEYERSVKALVPGLKGTFTCADDTLSFKGTQRVQFHYKDKAYHVDYPASQVISNVITHCSLNIRPLEAYVAAEFKSDEKMYAGVIERALRKNNITDEVSESERKVLILLMATLNPKAEVSTGLKSIPPKVESNSNQKTTVKVPNSEQPTNNPSTQLNTDEMVNNNISGQ